MSRSDKKVLAVIAAGVAALLIVSCSAQTPSRSAEENYVLRLGDVQAAYDLAMAVVVRQSPEVQRAVYPYGVYAHDTLLAANLALQAWISSPDPLTEMEIEHTVREAEAAILALKEKVP